MKKLLTTFLLACACGCAAIAAIGCESPSSGSSAVIPQLGDKRTITFEKGVGFTPKSNAIQDNDGTSFLYEGSMLSFSLELGAFYAGAPIAYVNDEAIVADAQGNYTYAVQDEDLTIRVEGIRKDVSNMAGSGTMEDAWVVTRPIDLLKIAEEVNKGNASYTQGAYVLANDIDCKGEELEIIGDYSTQDSVFSGSFACASNPETGEIERHTISNFKINSNDKPYVGLFGAVFASAAEGSAQFYGIRLADFEIVADQSEIKGDSQALFCGSLVAYGVGVRMFLCDAVNGDLFVNADDMYFAFTGGLIGYQQGFYDATYGMTYPTEIAYSVVDTNVTVTDGVALYAGGIAGYMATTYPYGATASIHNSYSLGNVSGGLRSGGIVGGMGQYTSASNCYASGNISAVSYQSKDSAMIDTEDYCHAYAGGLVGHAENDSILHDAFYGGKIVSASTKSKPEDVYAHTSRLVAGGDEAATISVDSKKYVVLNCLENVNLSDVNQIPDELGWKNYDWVFTADKLPEIFYGSPSETIQLNIKVIYTLPNGEEVEVNGNTFWEEKFFDSSTQSNSYSPLGSFVIGNSNEPIIAQTHTTAEGLLSFGYFFDKACTQPVPAAYIPTKNITLYVGFHQALEGTYYMENDDRALSLTFHKDGTVTYTDGATQAKAIYSYDGNTVVIQKARLARYYQGEIVIDELDTTTFQDPNFDLNRYSFFNFAGKLEEGKIKLWDGNFFTEEAPLVYTTNAPTASTDDAFTGTWVANANVNKTYTFDGKGNWTYLYLSYEHIGTATMTHEIEKLSGTYTLSADKTSIQFTRGGQSYTAKFNGDGYLEVGKTSGGIAEVFYANYSFVGNWKGSSYQLNLFGIRENGIGDAEYVDEEGYVTNFYYEWSETDGYVALYYPELDKDGKELLSKESLFGYAYFNAKTNSLHLVLPSNESNANNTTYIEEELRLYDSFYGDWISSHSDFQGASLHFNGMGLYNGLLTITFADGSTEEVSYTLNGSAEGTIGEFAYKNIYKLHYDEVTNKIVILSKNSNLVHEDELGVHDFVDIDGNRYDFDGRSPLGKGTLTIGNAKYYYKANGKAFQVTNLNGTVVGSVEKTDSHYLLTLQGKKTELYVSNKFMGDWAISSQYQLLKIGPTDLNGKIKANYKGFDVDMEFLNAQMLTFYYRDEKENGMPYTYYVFISKDGVTGEDLLALSEFPYIIEGNYIFCTRVNEYFGEWEYTNTAGLTMTLRFDGITSNHVYGFAELEPKLQYNSAPTGYYYMIREKGMVMWSRDLLAGRTWYYRLDLVSKAEAAGKAYFTHTSGNVDKVLLRTEVDGMYLSEATDEDDNEYFFGHDLEKDQSILYVNGEAKYTYKVKAYNADNTVTVHITDMETEKTYQATYKRLDEKLIIGAEVSEETEDESEKAE